MYCYCYYMLLDQYFDLRYVQLHMVFFTEYGWSILGTSLEGKMNKASESPVCSDYEVK